MRKILSAIACNLDANIISASLPLLEESRVEAIEWSFDALFNVKEIPSWFIDLITAFSKENRLIGHGIFFSLFSGRWLPGQADWLKQLSRACQDFHFDHITEHFGFMTGQDFHHGAPLNIPYTASTFTIGIDRLKRIYDACQCPVGLENLAFSYSLEEVKRHGEFLEKLVEPVNGFIILDLHNLYCQINNFDIRFESLMDLYPLDKVREIHISGGSWDQSLNDPQRIIRRDTHDDAVPQEVFDLLAMTMERCANLKYVVMEQLGNGLATDISRKLFYDDFLKMENMVAGYNNSGLADKIRDSDSFNLFLPYSPISPGDIIEDEDLHEQQLELSLILESSVSGEEAIQSLSVSSLSHSSWQIENWDPCMLETAIKIAQKWKK